MTSTKEKFAEMQQKFLQEILASDKSRFEKLKEIKEAKLWDYEDSVVQVFLKQEEELTERIKAKSSRDWVITDDYFAISDYQRHEVIDFVNMIQWGDREDSDVMITVVTARGDEGKGESIKMSVKDFNNAILDYAFENEVLGFEMDW